MSIRCDVMGMGILFGNNVSHAKNRTKTHWKPNIRTKKILSKKLGGINLRISTRGLRTLEKHGGLDNYLLQTLDRKLTPICLKIKTLLKNKV